MERQNKGRTRLGQGHAMQELTVRQPPIESADNHAHFAGGEYQFEILGTVLGQDRNAVAPPDTKGEQYRREPVHPRVESRVGEAPQPVDDLQPLGMQPGTLAEQHSDGEPRRRPRETGIYALAHAAPWRRMTTRCPSR